MNSLDPSRRTFLYGLGASIGGLAFTDMLARDAQADQRDDAISQGIADSPLTPRALHVPAKAKACIMLYMAGGPSHIDTFDPKPKLDELHMKKFVRQDKFASAMASGERYFVKSPVSKSPGWRVRHFDVRALSSSCPTSRMNCAFIAVAKPNRSITRPRTTT